MLEFFFLNNKLVSNHSKMSNSARMGDGGFWRFRVLALVLKKVTTVFPKKVRDKRIDRP